MMINSITLEMSKVVSLKLPSAKNLYFLKYMSLPPMDVQQPWLDEIDAGRKTVEGRTGPLSKYKPLIGNIIEMYDPAQPSHKFKVLVTDVRHYDTLESYINAEGWEAIAPHTGSIGATFAAYYSIYMDTPDGRVQVFSPDRIRARGGINAVQILRL
jgi:ASC-1-like (ASCH) protein